MDALKALFNDFDIGSLIPDLSGILGWVELIVRIAVMAGPILLLGLGLIFLVAAPKEANYSLGYRFWWGMASLSAWQFTQRLAGMVWTALGAVLTIIMAVQCNGFRDLLIMDMIWKGIRCVLWELGLTALACLIIDLVVIICFDRHGFRRKKTRHIR